MQNFTLLYSKEGFILIMKGLGYIFQEDHLESFRLIFADETGIEPSSIKKTSIQFRYTDFGQKDLSDMLDLVSARNHQFSCLVARENMKKELREFFDI